MVAPLAALALVLTAVTGGEQVNSEANSGQFLIYRITVNDPVEGQIAVITFVSPAEIDAIGGLPSQILVGRQIRIAEGLDPDNFTQNRAFVDFLHALVREVVPTG